MLEFFYDGESKFRRYAVKGLGPGGSGKAEIAAYKLVEDISDIYLSQGYVNEK